MNVLAPFSFGWNMTAGITKHDLGQITVLDAQKNGVRCF